MILVETYNSIIGFHYFKNAPSFCKYLSAKHRHNFVVKCKFNVNHTDRQIEINEQQNEIEKFLKSKYSKDGIVCDFDGLSCEQIASVLINQFNAFSVSVYEDNYGGATITR